MRATPLKYVVHSLRADSPGGIDPGCESDSPVATSAENTNSSECTRDTSPSACDSPLGAVHRWRDLNAADRAFYIAFDDLTLPTPHCLTAWLSGVVISLLLGGVHSLSFAMVGRFSMAGVPNTPAWEHVLCAVGNACAVQAISFCYVFYDLELATAEWEAYYLLCNALALVIRVVVEQATEARPGLVGLYAAFPLIGLCLLPLLQGCVRITGTTALNWRYPWTWSLKSVRETLPTDYLGPAALGTLISALTVLFIGIDSFCLTSPAIPPFVHKWLRPPFGFFLRYLMFWFNCALISRLSPKCPPIVWGLLFSRLCQALVLVRLASGCKTFSNLLVIIAFDWLAFASRSLLYWIRSRPRASEAQFRERLEHRRTFVLALMALPSSDTDLAPYFGFDYMLENLCLSVCYVSMLAGYAWHRLLGLAPGDAVHDLWFPYASQSFRFCAILAVLDLVQDGVGHVIYRLSCRRHVHVCHMTRVFPGWLHNPWLGLWGAMRVTAVTWVLLVWPTQWSFAFQAA